MKRYISAVLVPCLLLQFYGCSSKEVMTKNTFVRNYTLSGGNNSNDIYVNTKNDDQYFFEAGHYSFEKDSLAGTGKRILTTKWEYFEGKIAFADILTVEQETTSTGNTIILILGITLIGLAVVVGIAAAAFSTAFKGGCNSIKGH